MLEALLIGVLGPQLVLIAIGDLRGWKIRNAANLALAATYVGFALFVSDVWTLAAHAAFALVMFALMLFPFSRGWLGGGDVKFLAAAFLWTGLECASTFSLALLPPMLVYLALIRLQLVPVKREGRLNRVPFGPTGALALGVTLAVCNVF